MDILPSEYQQLNLSRTEKMFIRYAESSDAYGFILLNTNPAMIEKEMQHIVINNNGVLLLKFFDSFNNSALFEPVMGAYFASVYDNIFHIVYEKMKMNKALIGNDGKLVIKYNYICIFPNLERSNIGFEKLPDSLYEYAKNNCIFKEDFLLLKKNFSDVIDQYLHSSSITTSNQKISICDYNVNAILQRVAPEYTTIRISNIEERETNRGANNEMLVVTADDIAVRAFMLDIDQINIINKINKGDQLILACAGSGKSVLLISKCFKAARMNPEKKFLITCYSRQLQSLYSWYIDRAGLQEKNVECITFHKLCKKMAEHGNFYLNGDPEGWADIVTEKLNRGVVKDRYYGIFIDEVQLFEQEWYKLCFNLLENKNSDEHLFVICGDKTQKIKKQQKRGKAPWNAGESYPNYRGGNKNIRIEKNYRNCAEINNYINRFVSYAKKILHTLPGNEQLDPDMFLRGKAIRSGVGAYIKKLPQYTSRCEAEIVTQTIHEIHDNNKIPYDEIAVVMYNKTYSRKMPGWIDKKYNLEYPLLARMMDENIPNCMMYANRDKGYATRYGEEDGVVMISFESVLGLDFRAVIVCGLKPFGDYDKTKCLEIDSMENIEENNDYVDDVKNNISKLYVACTRARDLLYIIQPEEPEDSMYIKLLVDATIDLAKEN